MFQLFVEPSIVPVLKVLAIGFFFVPFGSITHALLTREFRADKQAYVNAIGTILRDEKSVPYRELHRS